MAGYSSSITRTDLGASQLPTAAAKEIIQEAPKQSVVLTRARRAMMSTKEGKQPVLTSLPKAYWVGGDTGLKQTDKASWGDLTITAEELAIIVPIPDALIDDADIPLWDEVKPLLAEAIGLAIDEAALFGVNKPSTWPTAVVPAALAAGNAVVAGTGADLGVDVATLGQKIAKQGYSANGFASEPGLQWELVALRSKDSNMPIYTSSLTAGTPSTLYGYPLHEVDNGAWDSGQAKLLAADWTRFVVGVRQDMTYEMFKEGVISDDEGKIILNLMQQDMKAMRLVMRVGFQVAKPLTRLGGLSGYPAGIITS